MGTIAVSRVLDRVSKKLLDEAKVRWKAPELLTDYNAIKNTIVALKADAFVQTQAYELAAGSKQEIPETAVGFRRLTRWMGADGATPGEIITLVDRDDMDACRPGWHIEAGTSVIHFIHDKEIPRIFYVYPNATGWVEGVWTATPPDATDPATDLLPFDDSYEECVFRGLMAAAHLKNVKSLDMNRVAFYEGQFNQFLGLKGGAQYRFAAKAAAQERAAEKPGGEI